MDPLVFPQNFGQMRSGPRLSAGCHGIRRQDTWPTRRPLPTPNFHRIIRIRVSTVIYFPVDQESI